MNESYKQTLVIHSIRGTIMFLQARVPLPAVYFELLCYRDVTIGHAIMTLLYRPPGPIG